MPRLYVPMTPQDLHDLANKASCRPDLAFTVTPQVRAEVPAADEEEHEYLVTQIAAAASDSDPIVVAVFQVDDRAAPALVETHAPLGSLALSDDLARPDLVCLLVGDPGERVRDDADLELSWYDASELEVVCRLLERH